jgi:hypothetical protein
MVNPVNTPIAYSGIGIGGQRQHQGDGDAGRVVRPSGAEGAGGELGQHGDAAARRHMLAADQHRQPDQHRAEQRAEHQLGALGAPGARLAEDRHPVGDRFDPGQRRAGRSGTSRAGDAAAGETPTPGLPPRPRG